MFFSKTLILAFAVSALALPTGNLPQKRAGVLTSASYADFQVSDGVAGSALDEVKAKFPVSLNPSQLPFYLRETTNNLD